MCGICGWVGKEPGQPRAAQVACMVSALAHRGPDECQIWQESSGTAVLGHTRLSIIDVAGSHQPMANEDGSIVLVYNGEVYNFQPLRERLLKQGHVFRTRGDTEVLLHLYEELGAEMARELDGIFAFAIYDRARRRLLLARDRIGIKPLYYWHDHRSGDLVFASDLHGLLANSAVPRRLSGAGLAQFLQFGYAVHPTTWVEGVRQLPPGALLEWNDGAIRVRQYYQWEYRPSPELATPSAALSALEECVDASVASQLVSDVPLGSFLSGGLDSTAVTAFAQRTRHAQGDAIRSFTVKMLGERDESMRARGIAGDLHTRHTEIAAQQLAFGRTTLETIARRLGEPFGDDSSLAVFLLCREARQHVTVALAGDGGDELFLGYLGLRRQRLSRRARVIPRPLRAALAAHLPREQEWSRKARKLLWLSTRGDSHLIVEWARRWEPEMLEAILSGEVLRTLYPDPEDPAPAVRAVIGAGEVGGFQEQQIRFHMLVDLPCDCLLKVDRMSMAHSMEVRVPLLSNAMLDYASELPLAQREAGGRTKEPLRTLAERLSPTVAEPSPKRGFDFPLAEWLRPHLVTAWREWEVTACLGEIGFNQSALDRLVASYASAAGAGKRYEERLLAGRLFDLLLVATWIQTHGIDPAVGEAA